MLTMCLHYVNNMLTFLPPLQIHFPAPVVDQGSLSSKALEVNLKEMVTNIKLFEVILKKISQ